MTKKDLLNKLKKEKLYQKGGTDVDSIDATTEITSLNKDITKMPINGKLLTNINTIQDLINYTALIKESLGAVYTTLETTNNLDARVANIENNILSILSEKLGYAIDDDKNRLLTLMDFTGNYDGTFKTNGAKSTLESAIASVPIAQFKHLPDINSLLKGGGNRNNTRKSKMRL